jgi:hypothetical protein
MSTRAGSGRLSSSTGRSGKKYRGMQILFLVAGRKTLKGGGGNPYSSFTIALTVNCFFISDDASTRHPDRVTIIVKDNARQFSIMSKVDVKENIKRIIDQIDGLTKELFRLEGSLRVFQEFEKNGVLFVDVPESTETEAPAQEEEVKET